MYYLLQEIAKLRNGIKEKMEECLMKYSTLQQVQDALDNSKVRRISPLL